MPNETDSNAPSGTDRRSRILDGALALFARRGYSATSVKQIAEEAGVSQGLMYNYFPGKAGLLRAAMERSMEDVWASFERAANGRDARAQLEALPREALAGVRADREFWQVSYQLRMQPDVVEGLAEEIAGWSRAIRERIEPLLEVAGSDDAPTDARVLFAAIDGAAQHMVLDLEGYPAEAVARGIARRFLPASPPPRPPLAGGHP